MWIIIIILIKVNSRLWYNIIRQWYFGFCFKEQSSRTYAGAGGLRYTKVGNITEANTLIKIGKLEFDKDMKYLYQIIVDHPCSQLDNIVYVSLGHSLNMKNQIRCYVSNIKGKSEFYYDKDTLEIFFKAMQWDIAYFMEIDCATEPAYEKVQLNPEKHRKITSL